MRGVSGCDDVLTTQNNPNATLWNEAYTFARWIDTNYPNKPVDDASPTCGSLNSAKAAATTLDFSTVSQGPFDPSLFKAEGVVLTEGTSSASPFPSRTRRKAAASLNAPPTTSPR
jgi:hypothetical protein